MLRRLLHCHERPRWMHISRIISARILQGRKRVIVTIALLLLSAVLSKNRVGLVGITRLAEQRRQERARLEYLHFLLHYQVIHLLTKQDDRGLLIVQPKRGQHPQANLSQPCKHGILRLT